MLRHSPLAGMQLRWIAYANANASGTVNAVVSTAKVSVLAVDCASAGRPQVLDEIREADEGAGAVLHAADEDRPQRQRQEHEQRRRDERDAAARGHRLDRQRR